MNQVKLSPGETLALSLGTSSAGEKVLLVAYDDLVKRLTVVQKSRRSKTPGALLSRRVGLYARAIRAGKWSTGAKIDVNEIKEKLAGQITAATDEDLKQLSYAAIQALVQIHDARMAKELNDPIRRVKVITGWYQA